MKKPTLMLILCTMLFYCCQKQKDVKLLYIDDPNTETPFRIDCKNFNSYFKEGVKDKYLTMSSENFKLILDSLIEEESGYKIDTRCQILLKQNEKMDTLCMDIFHITYNGKILKVSNDLKKLIWDK